MTNNRKILEIKKRAEQIMKDWNYPNEHYIEANGALMVCNELLASLKDEGEKHSQAWECPRCYQMHSYLKSTCDCPPKTITSSTYSVSQPIEGEKVMSKGNDTLDDRIRETMRPIRTCPLCGETNIKTKVSFKGRSMYRNKRKTQYCPCGWSRILPTEREALTELGEIN